MFDKNEIIKEWLEIDKFTGEELEYIKAECPDKIENEFDKVMKEQMLNSFFKLLPYGHLNSETYDISFSEHATDFINLLFKQHVDNDTLVVVSNNEHENVIKNFTKLKNVYILDFDTEIMPCKLNKLYSECSKYKKIFVYIIGTQVSNGIITPQAFFEKIKNWLTINKKEHTLVIDDVHGLFIIPRNYSLFDYVIYTCHALIKQFDMGILISKKEQLVKGKNYIQCGFAYLNAIKTIFEHYTKFYTFKHVLYQYFYDEIASGKLTFNYNTAPHIFAPEIHGLNLNKKDFDEIFNELKKYSMRIEGGFDENGKCVSKIYLRIREGQYFTYPERLIPGLEIVKSILNTIE